MFAYCEAKAQLDTYISFQFVQYFLPPSFVLYSPFGLYFVLLWLCSGFASIQLREFSSSCGNFHPVAEFASHIWNVFFKQSKGSGRVRVCVITQEKRPTSTFQQISDNHSLYFLASPGALQFYQPWKEINWGKSSAAWTGPEKEEI